MIPYLTNLNNSVNKSDDLNSEGDNLIYKLLYLSYISFFSALLLTNKFFLAYEIFLIAVVPISMIPAYISTYRNVVGSRRFNLQLSFINPIKTLVVIRSHIFRCACLYAAAITFSSWLYPSPSVGWLLDLLKYFISILLFLAITARILGQSPKSMEIMCTILCVIVSINATINILTYFQALSKLGDFSIIRLTPSFGRVPDHYPTTSAFTYAIFFGISICLAIQSKQIITRIIISISSAILLAGIILTQSRGPLIAAILSLIIISFYLSSRLREILILTSGIIVSGFLLLPGIGVWAIQRGENGRLEVWHKFMSLALLRPFLGYGEKIEFHIALADGQIIGHAHNIYFNALLRGGVIACLALITITGFGLKYSIYFLKRTSSCIPMSSLLTLVIAGLVDFDLIIFLADWQWPSLWFIIGLLISSEVTINSNNLT